MRNSEHKVEAYLHDKVVAMGGTTRKFVSPGHRGVADRLVFMPEGRIYLIEIKTKNGDESFQQRRERLRMLSLGFNAVVLYGTDGVDNFVNKRLCHV